MSPAVAGGAAVSPWLALLLLGALHGLNPGMGWLFAVALGMQRGERRAVWGALLPLAAGHALAIAAAVGVAAGLGMLLPPRALRWLVVLALLALGARQLRRHAHPRGGGMRVGARDLVSWSFLVATAHGAGLMAAPFALGASAALGVHDLHAMHGAHAGPRLAAVALVSEPALAATAVHSASYLLVTTLLAVVVYERAALHLLRRAWINLDLVWAAALVLTAAAIAVT